MAEGLVSNVVPGARVDLKHVFTLRDVEDFARLSGDHNPLHLDDAYAAGTRFGRRVVHGLLTAGLFSTLLSSRLPGEGTIYLSQSLEFKAPVYVGEEVVAEVQVISLHPVKPIATLRTVCRKADGTVVIEGQAVVMFTPGQ